MAHMYELVSAPAVALAVMQWQSTVRGNGAPMNSAYANVSPSIPATTSTPAASACAAAPVFGVIVPGCPVQTNLEPVDSGRWTMQLGLAPETFVVFLTMSEPLPPGYGVGLFIARADSMNFQYVGALTQQRPSTLLKTPTVFLDAGQPITIVLGLALEREEELVNLGVTQEQPLQQVQAATKFAIAERILEDLYGFVASYARSINWSGGACSSDYGSSGLGSVEPGDYVVMPSSFVDKWRVRVRSKIQKDASFWQ